MSLSSRLSRMDELLSRNNSYNKFDKSTYRNNTSFENQLSFVKGYMIDKQQQQQHQQQYHNNSSTYMNSNTKIDSIFSNQSTVIPQTNRLPPSNKKQSSYYTPQKDHREVLSQSIYEKDTHKLQHSHSRNLSSMNSKQNNINNHYNNENDDYILRKELKDISSIKKKSTTPLKERKQNNYIHNDDQDDCHNDNDDELILHKRSLTPCQKILQSIEKENQLLKSEIKEHTDDMRDINQRIKEIEKENKQLRNALQKYYDREENEERIREQHLDGIKLLKQEVAQQNVTNSNLIRDIEILTQQVKEFENEKEKYYKKCVILAKRIKNYENVKTDLQEKICNIEPELDKQQIKNELLEQDARHIQMELDFWRSKAEDQEVELMKLRRTDERLRIRLQEYEDLEAQEKEKQLTELNDIRYKYRNLEIEYNDMKEQLNRVKKELGNNDFSQDSAQDIIANLKAKLHVETSRADSSISREKQMKNKVEQLEKQIKQLKERNSDLEIQMTKIDAEQKVAEDINNCNYEKVVERINLIRSKNKVEDYSRDQNYLIEKLCRDLDMKEVEIQSLKDNFDSLYLQLIENQNLLKEEISSKNKVEQEKQQQMIELNNIKKEISKYKQNLESFKQNLTESQLKTSRSKLTENSDIHLNTIQNTIPNSSNNNNINLENSNGFGDKLKQLESTIADVQNKKKQINQDNQLLKQRLQSLDNQLSHRQLTPSQSQTNLSQQSQSSQQLQQ